jgi:transcriptional regulator with XRE-family HTH domain
VADDGGDRFYERLGERVRERRRAKCITQEELADVLQLNRTTIVNIEKGRQRLAVHQLVRIADHLGCPVADLIPTQEEEQLLTDKQRSRVADPAALGFITGVAAEARRTR